MSCDAANSSGACRQQSPVATDAPNINTTWCNGSINACPNGQCQKDKFGLWACSCNGGFVLNSRSQLCVPEPPCDQDSFDDGSAPCIRSTSTGCFKVEKHGSSHEWNCTCASGELLPCANPEHDLHRLYRTLLRDSAERMLRCDAMRERWHVPSVRAIRRERSLRQMCMRPRLYWHLLFGESYRPMQREHLRQKWQMQALWNRLHLRM